MASRGLQIKREYREARGDTGSVKLLGLSVTSMKKKYVQSSFIYNISYVLQMPHNVGKRIITFHYNPKFNLLLFIPNNRRIFDWPYNRK